MAKGGLPGAVMFNRGELAGVSVWWRRLITDISPLLVIFQKVGSVDKISSYLGSKSESIQYVRAWLMGFLMLANF